MARPVITRVRWWATPADAYASLADRWFSASMSMVVRMPSEGMPSSSQSPETPAPVPTSTTALAPTAAAIIRRAAPPPGPIGVQPSSSPRCRAFSAISLSATKSSAYPQLAAFCALMARPYSAHPHDPEHDISPETGLLDQGRVRVGPDGWLAPRGGTVNSSTPR